MTSLKRFILALLNIKTFKFAFLLTSFFYSFPFTALFTSKIVKMFIIWAFFIILYDIFKKKSLTLKNNAIWLIIMILLMGISCLTNYHHNFLPNIIITVYLVIEIIFMLLYDKKETKTELLKEIKLFSSIIIILTFLCSIASLIIYFTEYKTSVMNDFTQLLIGFFDGRLWGIYGNPNTLGQLSLISIFLSLLLLHLQPSKKITKVGLILNIIIEWMCILLANSRSNFVGAICSLLMYLLFYFRTKRNESLFDVIKTVIKFTLSIFLIIGITIGMKYGFSIADNLKKYFQESNVQGTNVQGTNVHEPEKKPISKPILPPSQILDSSKFDRTDQSTVDISNGRYAIWSSGLHVFQEKPIFGVGFKNVNQETNRFMDEEIVKNQPHLTENMHNIYLQILVSNGIFAFLCFIIYFVKFLPKVLKYLFCYTKNSQSTYIVVLTLFSLIVSLCIINLFDSNILYFFTLFIVPIFWMSNSYVERLMSVEKEATDKKNILILKNKSVNLTKYFDNKKYNIYTKNLLKYILSNKDYDVEVASSKIGIKFLSIMNHSSLNIAFQTWFDEKKIKNKKRFIKTYLPFNKVICTSTAIEKEFTQYTNLYQKIETINNKEDLDRILCFKDEIKKNQDLFCTVFTPTYNRAYCLESLYQSLKKQTLKDFEWLVIDDGSKDNTEKLFEKWQKEKNDFKINYIRVNNGGKQRAINQALDYAKGKMFFIVDSDDYLADNAIEQLAYFESTIANDNFFAGVSGLRGYPNGKIIGSCAKKKYIDCLNTNRNLYHLLGDKAECYYTDLLKRYKFPDVKDEKFVSENVVWNQIGFDGYKIRWFSDIIYVCEYLEDGLTNQGITLYKNNPVGYLLYIRNTLQYTHVSLLERLSNYYGYYDTMKNTLTKKEIAENLLTNRGMIEFAIIAKKIKDRIER